MGAHHVDPLSQSEFFVYLRGLEAVLPALLEQYRADDSENAVIARALSCILSEIRHEPSPRVFNLTRIIQFSEYHSYELRTEIKRLKRLYSKTLRIGTRISIRDYCRYRLYILALNLCMPFLRTPDVQWLAVELVAELERLMNRKVIPLFH